MKRSTTFMVSIFFLMISTIALAEVPISLLPNPNFVKHSLDAGKIIDIVRKELYLDTSSEADYHSAKVKVEYDEKYRPNFLVVYLLSKNSYTLEITGIKLAENYIVEYVDPGFVESDSNNNIDIESPKSYASCPNTSINFVAATPVDTISSAKAAVDYVYNIVREKGLRAVKLLGNSATTHAYKNWLVCPNLKGFYNVGHGDSRGIMLANGILDYRFFDSLSSSGLRNRVIYFNSCEVHNNPLEGSIIGAGVQKYLGGNVKILIGASEQVSRCFWQRALAKTSLTSSLSYCENRYYPTKGAHGISGYGSNYFNYTPPATDTPEYCCPRCRSSCNYPASQNFSCVANCAIQCGKNKWSPIHCM